MLFEYYLSNKVVMIKDIVINNASNTFLVLALMSSSIFFCAHDFGVNLVEATTNNVIFPIVLDYDPGKNNIHKNIQFDGDESAFFTTTGTAPDTLKPIAEPGWLQSVQSNERVQLDGSTSSDPNHSALTYAWTQVMGPGVVLDNNLSEKPTFTAPKISKDVNLTFQLIVSNEDGTTSEPDYVTVFVN
jgi:hypothetical protein